MFQMFQNITNKQIIVSIISLSVVIIVGAIILTINQINTNERLAYLEGKVGK